MSKVSKALLLLMAILISALGAYAYDRHHLSADLKQTLIEASYPSNTFDQIDTYLHEARLQVHTRKDQEVYGKFFQAVRLAEGIHSSSPGSGSPEWRENAQENEQESKKLYTEVRADLGLTQFQSIYLPLFR